MDEELRDQYAELIAGFGANVRSHVSGVTRAGDELPLLVGGTWQI